MTQDMWVDGQGLPLKTVTRTPDGKGRTIPVELTYSAWGKAPIAVPPPSQVTSLSFG